MAVSNVSDYPTREVTFDFAFDSSYPTGGESLTPNSVGLSEVKMAVIAPKAGYVFEYDYDNDKIKAYVGDNDAVADGAMAEVANATDLSGVTGVKCMFKGY